MRAVDPTKSYGSDYGSFAGPDIAERAIAREQERIEAREVRLKQLERDGQDCEDALMQLARRRERLLELIKLRALVLRAIDYKASMSGRSEVERWDEAV